jgi:uncharacterized protein
VADVMPRLVDFARALRAAGLTVGSGDIVTYVRVMSTLDPADIEDLYWGGRTALVTRRDDIPVYDRVFREFFLGQATNAPKSRHVDSVLTVPLTENTGEERANETRMGLAASAAEVLRHREFAECTPEELAALRRIIARFKLIPPSRRTRRTRPARKGKLPDMRRTVRKALRTLGEPKELAWRRRKMKPRPLVLILDVSGSMADYSRTLLQFAHSARRATKVEVFCFGTRLTRITPALRARGVDEALRQAGRTVFDWDGGTRIGDSLHTFVRDWGKRRGGVVLICSDGLDRGDPAVLDQAMRRLSLLSHRVVWLNPHSAATVGMAVATPHADLVLTGLRGLDDLAAVLPRLG